jgi:hypothetical protein
VLRLPACCTRRKGPSWLWMCSSVADSRYCPATRTSGRFVSITPARATACQHACQQIASSESAGRWCDRQVWRYIRTYRQENMYTPRLAPIWTIPAHLEYPCHHGGSTLSSAVWPFLCTGFRHHLTFMCKVHTKQTPDQRFRARWKSAAQGNSTAAMTASCNEHEENSSRCRQPLSACPHKHCIARRRSAPAVERQNRQPQRSATRRIVGSRGHSTLDAAR